MVNKNYTLSIVENPSLYLEIGYEIFIIVNIKTKPNLWKEISTAQRIMENQVHFPFHDIKHRQVPF